MFLFWVLFLAFVVNFPFLLVLLVRGLVTGPTGNFFGCLVA